jgi:hypothetical protein
METDLYRSTLRVGMLVTATVLVFDSGLLFPVTKQLSNDTQVYLAEIVSVGAQIEPNELNTLSEELRKRDEELKEREASIRTIEARMYGEGNSVEYSTYILSFLLFVLTALVLFNYLLDWKRAKMMQPRYE